MVKNLPANAREVRDVGSIPGTGRSPEGGPGNPLHYSCLKNPMDRGGWWATVHRVTQHAHPKQMSYCYLWEDQTEREKNKAKMRINSYIN